MPRVLRLSSYARHCWRLKTRYGQLGFQLHAHLENDLLMIVLSTEILIDTYALPALQGTGAVATRLEISEMSDTEPVGRTVEPSAKLGVWE